MFEQLQVEHSLFYIDQDHMNRFKNLCQSGNQYFQMFVRNV